MNLTTTPFLLAGACALMCGDKLDSPPTEPELGPMIAFDTTLFDFGTIPFAANGTCSFPFTNTGDAPLIIETFQSSCGCLVPDWDPEPVLPGHKGNVRLKYDTRRAGPFQKTATLRCNASNTPVVLLRIKGTVLASTGTKDH
ncbi:MAG: DUF1573 domain-containing protein [Flavobacteriales bacterium]